MPFKGIFSYGDILISLLFWNEVDPAKHIFHFRALYFSSFNDLPSVAPRKKKLLRWWTQNIYNLSLLLVRTSSLLWKLWLREICSILCLWKTSQGDPNMSKSHCLRLVCTSSIIFNTWTLICLLIVFFGAQVMGGKW